MSDVNLGLAGAIYGTLRYGQGHYGRPLSANVPLPTFSTMPVTATPLDYETMVLRWTVPSQGVTLQLVRNTYSVSTDPFDGTVLLSQAVNGSPLFVDQALTGGNFSGTLLYYSLWVLDSNNDWWRGGDIEAVMPKDWGYANLLWNRLPGFYRDLDDKIGS